jgi:hypothetical protein
VYESVQKFGGLITSGKLTNDTNVSRVAELLSESHAFYDAEMISEFVNTILRHTNNNAITKVTAEEVRNIMNQLKVVGANDGFQFDIFIVVLHSFHSTYR